MYSFDDGDLMRLYAKLNAQDHLITTCLAALKTLAPDPPSFLEAMRTAAMDLADRQQLKPGEPNPEFGRNTQILTLQLIADAFQRLRSAGSAG
jgi:hypothetical protein